MGNRLVASKKKEKVAPTHTTLTNTHSYAHAHTRGLHFKAYCQGFCPKGLCLEFVSDFCKADCSIMGFLFFLLLSLWQKKVWYLSSISFKSKACVSENKWPNKWGRKWSQLSEGAYLVFRHTTSNFPCELLLLHPFTKRRLCHRHPSSCSWLLECGNRHTSTYILYTYSIFRCDSSNCG